MGDLLVENVFRIIAGAYKGRKLQGPKGTEFRPTTGRVKEFIFSYLGEFIQDAVVLDCFSGTGSLGLEALSRGARHVTFIEAASSSIRILKANLEKCNIKTGFQIYQQDVFDFFKMAGQSGYCYDLVLADPPFKGNYRNQIVEDVSKYSLLENAGSLIVEHESHDEDIGEHTLNLLRERQFGGCTVSIYE